MADLRFLVFGAGAIGTYLGGSLALSGREVVFIERPEVAAVLRERGLRLKLADGDHALPGSGVVSSAGEAFASGPFDAAIFAVKAYDSAALLAGLEPFKSQLPAFVSIQNGVENEARLADFLGPGRVIPASLTTAVGRRTAGDIVLERLRGIGLSARHPLSAALNEAFEQAGLKPKLYANPDAMKWSKLLTNLIANASSAILNMTPAAIFAHPGLFRLEVRQLRETLDVMAAQKIPVVNLPGTPVRLLAFGVRRLPPPLLQPLLGRAAGSGRGGKMPSFHIDLYSGRGKSEVDYLNGAVVRYGQKLGVATPVNRVLNETLLALTSGQQAREDWAGRPEKLIAAASSS